MYRQNNNNKEMVKQEIEKKKSKQYIDEMRNQILLIFMILSNKTVSVLTLVAPNVKIFL